MSTSQSRSVRSPRWAAPARRSAAAIRPAAPARPPRTSPAAPSPAGVDLPHRARLRVDDREQPDVGQPQLAADRDLDREHVVAHGELPHRPLPGRLDAGVDLAVASGVEEVGHDHPEPAPARRCGAAAPARRPGHPGRCPVARAARRSLPQQAVAARAGRTGPASAAAAGRAASAPRTGPPLPVGQEAPSWPRPRLPGRASRTRAVPKSMAGDRSTTAQVSSSRSAIDVPDVRDGGPRGHRPVHPAYVVAGLVLAGLGRLGARPRAAGRGGRPAAARPAAGRWSAPAGAAPSGAAARSSRRLATGPAGLRSDGGARVTARRVVDAAGRAPGAAAARGRRCRGGPGRRVRQPCDPYSGRRRRAGAAVLRRRDAGRTRSTTCPAGRPRRRPRRR